MLPITPFLPAIVEEVRRRRAAVVTAAPGAGKTTQVPPALVEDGPVLLLQPRRMAARSIAARIAAEQSWTLGREVGWQVRFERRFSAATRLLVATEGILTARAQNDPLLSDFRTIVLDEFHERSIHADLGLALARQAWLARDDLRVVVMSATLDAAAAAAFLHDCPVVEVPGRTWPLDVHYEPALRLRDAVERALAATQGDVLCFLPGVPEIRRAEQEIGGVGGSGVEVGVLHGAMDAAEQGRILTPGDRRRVVLSTNVAETSLTVPGVRAVVDTGRHKVARYDPARAIDSLTTERISQDSADQRAGRAGRLAAGAVWRLWNRADRLRPHREPDIERIDLTGPALDVMAWGGDPRTFDWFEPPPAGALDAAMTLLERLGAVAHGALTPLGVRMAGLPLPPRLSRILLAAGGSQEASLACALLAERGVTVAAAAPTTSANDLASAVDRASALPPHVHQVAATLRGMLNGGGESAPRRRDLRHALLDGYPDRVGRRRRPGSPRVLLASGHGAVIGPESGVRDGEFILALDVTAGQGESAAEARIRLAATVERDWLTPTATRVEHWLDAASGAVRAAVREYYGALVLRERPAAVDPEEASRLLVGAYVERGFSDDDRQLMRRLRFAGLAVDANALLETAAAGRRRLDEIDLASAIDWPARQAIDRLAPATLPVPSGRSVRLDYHEDGTVRAGVKLQELFGLADTPRLGPRREPVLIELRAPSGRPVQLTRDLRSFWENTYPEVRRELRGRYPKHPWPEDPWTATPTARTTRRQA